MLVALVISIPLALVLLALVALFATRPYAVRIGWRYLRSKKRGTISVITVIAVTGVALGVAALVAVMSITSGFQEEFRNKVLGVNAHVLVLKYGLDFEEYRDVVQRAREMPEVAGAAPFLIHDMMLAHGDRVSGVLVKGVDPELMPTVLDLPSQMTQGSLRGLRRPGAAPPTLPEDLGQPLDTQEQRDLDRWLRGLAGADAGVEPGVEPSVEPGVEPSVEPSVEPGVEPAVEPPTPASPTDFIEVDTLPEVEVPSTDQVNQALEGPLPELPDDDIETQIFREEQDLLENATQQRTQDLPGIIVGATLASTLGIGVGDRVKVISPLSGLDTSMFGESAPSPTSIDFRVIGIFEAGFQEYDSRLVYVDLYECERFFDHGDSVTGVEIRLHDIDQAPSIARRLERVLGGGPYHTMDWQELNHNLFTALEIQKVMLSLVIATIIFVAAFNVIATLIMIVLEKKREIAILKAMGAGSFGMLLVFLLQGLLIGLLGTAIGLVLGGGICFYLERVEFPLDPHVYLIDHLPVRTSAWEFVQTVGITMWICLLATVVPSWWAARLLPVDGLRYE
ncbi:MAG: ABC transporter permease [Sandaracinaceae bacterium]|nr:ABC transporter permease [Sandaracinaceae bacterium]